MDIDNLFIKYMNKNFGTFSLPIVSNSPQTFTHRFADGRVYTVFIKYNRMFNQWLMDISLQNGETDTLQVSNVTLLFGLDLLSQYKYKYLGEFYVIPKNYTENDSPEYYNLNNGFYYIWRHN